jgi:hypothetical protein
MGKAPSARLVGVSFGRAARPGEGAEPQDWGVDGWIAGLLEAAQGAVGASDRAGAPKSRAAPCAPLAAGQETPSNRKLRAPKL